MTQRRPYPRPLRTAAQPLPTPPCPPLTRIVARHSVEGNITDAPPQKRDQPAEASIPAPRAQPPWLNRVVQGAPRTSHSSSSFAYWTARQRWLASWRRTAFVKAGRLEGCQLVRTTVRTTEPRTGAKAVGGSRSICPETNLCTSLSGRRRSRNDSAEGYRVSGGPPRITMRKQGDAQDRTSVCPSVIAL